MFSEKIIENFPKKYVNGGGCLISVFRWEKVKNLLASQMLICIDQCCRKGLAVSENAVSLIKILISIKRYKCYLTSNHGYYIFLNFISVLHLLFV